MATDLKDEVRILNGMVVTLMRRVESLEVAVGALNRARRHEVQFREYAEQVQPGISQAYAAKQMLEDAHES